MEKPFQNSAITRRLSSFQHATVPERSIEVRFSLIVLIYKVVYINIKDLHAGYMKYTRKLNYITPLKTDKMPPITPVNA